MAVLRLVSGFPALIYQIVWERALFAIYGVNIESVSIIVTIFMLGLGFGSLVGGRLSKVPIGKSRCEKHGRRPLAPKSRIRFTPPALRSYSWPSNISDAVLPSTPLGRMRARIPQGR